MTAAATASIWPACAHLARRTTLRAHDRLGFARTQAFVPHRRPAVRATRDASCAKAMRSTCLTALRAIGVERQADHELRDTLALGECRQRLEDRRQPVASVEHADAATRAAGSGRSRPRRLAVRPRRYPGPGHGPRRATWGLGRQRRYERRAAPRPGSCRPRAVRRGRSGGPGTRARLAACCRAARRPARACQWSFPARRWLDSARPLCARRPSGRRGLPIAPGCCSTFETSNEPDRSIRRELRAVTENRIVIGL